MLVWLTLPFYDFCGFRSVAVNSVFINCSFFYIFILKWLKVGLREQRDARYLCDCWASCSQCIDVRARCVCRGRRLLQGWLGRPQLLARFTAQHNRLAAVSVYLSRESHWYQHLLLSWLRVRLRPYQQHCRSNRQLYRMLQVERFFRQCRTLLRQSRTLLRHCCWYGGGLNESEILAVANASRISSSLARRRSLYDKYLRACRWSLLHYPHTIPSTIVFPTFGSAHHARWERYCVAYVLQIRTKNLLRSLEMIPLSTVDITYDISLVFCSHVSSLYGLLIYVQVK